MSSKRCVATRNEMIDSTTVLAQFCDQKLGKFPGYENGGSFFHSVGLEAMARGTVGDTQVGWCFSKGPFVLVIFMATNF